MRIDRYPQGTPSWIDLSTTDQDAAKSFYAGLFGWSYRDMPIELWQHLQIVADAAQLPTGDRVYTTATVDGASAAGIAAQPPEEAQRGIPPHWNVYLTVDDVDAAAVGAVEHGGAVLAEPFDVFDAGRMATIGDPTGAVVSLWQPRRSIGAQIRAEHGALCWAEVLTDDPAAVAEFLAALLDVRTETAPMPDGVEYTVVMAGDTPLAGVMAMPEHLREMRHPPHWSVYIQVDDTDAAVRAAVAAGGDVLVPAQDIATVGRIAFIADPQRAALGLLTPA